MQVTYDKNGLCTRCGLPGTGFVEDGVCECLDGDDYAGEDDPYSAIVAEHGTMFPSAIEE
jgi:hypothetical protein